MKKIIVIFLLTLSLTSTLTSKDNPQNESFSRKLQACPGSPNCVNSQEKSSWGKLYNVAPLKVPEHMIHPIEVLKTLLENVNEQYLNSQKLELLEELDDYLHYAYTVVIPSGALKGTYIDDLEILYNKKKQVLDIRSASRVGYRDSTNLSLSIPGANKRRVEALKSVWEKNL